jgi:hypothetical protein
MKAIKAEIANCRVLCSNCHRKEHWNRLQAKAQAKLLPNEKRTTIDERSHRNPFLLERIAGAWLEHATLGGVNLRIRL